MNEKKINFLINFEILFEIRALYVSAIRVVNQKYKFAEKLDLNKYNKETSSLISNLEIDNNIKFKVEELIIENIFTIKPKLYFIINFLTLTKFLRKKRGFDIYVYYDNDLLINENKHSEFFNNMKYILKNHGVKDIYFLNENTLLKNIDLSLFNQCDNFVIDFSLSKIQNLMNFLPNLNLYYKSNDKKNQDILEETKEKEFITDLEIKKIFYYKKYEEFLKSFYSEEELKSYLEYESGQIIYKYIPSYIIKSFDFIDFWRHTKSFKNPIILSGKAIKGFQRGSTQLGVPTANIEMTYKNGDLIEDMLSGIYVGHCKFLTNMSNNQNININKIYKGVLSIGWNPYYDNEVKTIEVFIIDYQGENFYNEQLEISINSFIRTEANFENFGELVTAITYDIIQAESMLSI